MADIPFNQPMTGYSAPGTGACGDPINSETEDLVAVSDEGWDEAGMIDILEHPDTADHAAYAATDSMGNAMQSPSLVELSGVGYRYGLVYHTPYPVSSGYRYQVNLAGSDDLVEWTFIRTIVDNGDMPKVARVSGANWIILAHEQWLGPGPDSSAPCTVAFQLFYTDADFVNGAIRATYSMPRYGDSDLNGTPSFYDAHLVLDSDYYSVDGQYGFHHWSGTRDVNGVTTITRMFDPRPGHTTPDPSTADLYNNAFVAQGVTGNVGQRDTIVAPFGRYNVQEGNVGTPGASWDKWRLWLYRYNETTAYPTGAGTVRQLLPVTTNGSVSFGNPSMRIVSAPDGPGQVMWVSYFLFSEGAGSGEAGSLIYWTQI
jgi:hypothetical protein